MADLALTCTDRAVKTLAIKVMGAVVLAVGVFAAFIASYPFIFSLGWPSLALALGVREYCV